MPTVKLNIADVIIKLESIYPIEQFNEDERRLFYSQCLNDFLWQGKRKSDISINIEISDKLPNFKGRQLFVTNLSQNGNFQHGNISWRLFKDGNTYIYKSPLSNKPQRIFLNKKFDNITAYLLPNYKGKVWDAGDIVYDFLQVLFINYLAQRHSGLIIHACGIKDIDGRGIIFTGKSGAGKTTLAEFWYNNSSAGILNDDRIIVRKNKHGKFLIYRTPWHGSFSDYLTSQKIQSAPFEKLFFIYQASKNKIENISYKAAFQSLYPCIFPTFWDKENLENVVSFSEDLLKNVPAYKLGFKKDKSIIEFVRSVK